MKKFINSDLFLELSNNSKIVILDGGGRGALFAPFDKVQRDRLLVLRVEPDNGAEVKQTENEIIFQKAIWNKKEKIQIYIANEPSTSSIYPPNLKFAGRFVDAIGLPARETKDIIEVQADTIDSIFEEQKIPYPDFIKLDIHGCEYEALQGAIVSLKKKTIALQIESWQVEAHIGQKLLFDTDKILHENSFYPFETNVCSWNFKTYTLVKTKEQAVISESLYFKDIVLRENEIDKVSAIKLIAIADLFGFVGFSLLVLNYINELRIINSVEYLSIKEFLISNNQKTFWDKSSYKILDKIRRTINNYIEY